MDHAWDIRLELLEISHRWYLVVAAFLLGSLLGWGAAFVFPTPYRAETELYVAYNADAIYRNPDDYKNWQLGELEAYIYSDDVLQETVGRLQAHDPAWASVTPADIRPLLHTYWRNAGKWRLVAELDDPRRAEELATLWRNAILDKTRAAIEHSKTGLVLGEQVRELMRLEAASASRSLMLEQSRNASRDWQQAAAQLDPRQPLPVLERWFLQGMAASAAGPDSAALDLLAEFPPEQAARQVYLEWAARLQGALEGELTLVQSQYAELSVQRQTQLGQYESISKAAHSMTVDLTVERNQDVRAEAFPVRASVNTALVGGVLGLLAWGIFWLLPPLRRLGQ